MTRAEEVVKGLSSAQARALLEAAEDGRGRLVVPSYYRTALRISSLTFRRLGRLGLIEPWPPVLTSHGEEVRTLLLEKKDA